MAKHSCLNVTSDGENYSSPMPVIGLYIAMATLVCFLSMLCDVLHGLRRRKAWIPCRFFSFNSLTLSLLAITSKLPVDITTSMPSALDQLSKLTGTTFICISMGFLMPSLGTQSESERFLNIGSLSILVVTVVVNVCIQMATGVIFSFVIEHVMILSCMMLLLMVLWGSAFEIGFRLEILNDTIQEDNINDAAEISMIGRLKSIYQSSYYYNPQFVISTSPHSITMVMLSAVSSLVLLQATIRSLFLKDVKFHCGISDYKWSMLIIVVTQFLTILLGLISTSCRWYTSVSHFNIKVFPLLFCPSEADEGRYVLTRYFTKMKFFSFFESSQTDLVDIFMNIAKNVFIVLQEGINIVVQLATCLPMVVRIYFPQLMSMTKIDSHSNIIWWRDQQSVAEKWMDKKTEDDLNRWVEKNKRDSPTNLIQLLSNTHITSSQLSLIDQIQLSSISCLTVVILARMASISLPNTFSAPLIHSLDEAFEIIYFIDKKTNPISFKNKMKWSMAKDVWMNKDNTNHWFHKKIIEPLTKKSYSTMAERSANGYSQSHLEIVKELFQEISLEDYIKNPIQCELLDNEKPLFHEILIKREESHPDEIFITQLFVDMLKFFLRKLPQAIFKHVVESPFEEFGDRARLGIKYLCKLEPLVDKVDWSFPENTGITSLIGEAMTGEGEIQKHV